MDRAQEHELENVAAGARGGREVHATGPKPGEGCSTHGSAFLASRGSAKINQNPFAVSTEFTDYLFALRFRPEVQESELVLCVLVPGLARHNSVHNALNAWPGHKARQAASSARQFTAANRINACVETRPQCSCRHSRGSRAGERRAGTSTRTTPQATSLAPTRIVESVWPGR